MTQVEKIKAEIESLQANTRISLNEYSLGYENGKAEVCGLLLNLINSMQKESECEDLELASERYACKFSNSKYGHDKVKDAIVWGANWQKEKMMKGAVESVFIQDYGYAKPVLYGDLRRALNIESRDKLKLIIIKKD